jgi:hypothetical protein
MFLNLLSELFLHEQFFLKLLINEQLGQILNSQCDVLKSLSEIIHVFLKLSFLNWLLMNNWGRF